MTTAATQKTVPSILIAQWTQINQKIAAVAAEFPEERYESASAGGARTFGSVLRHLAFWNQYLANLVRGIETDGTLNELPEGEYRTKADVIAALETSTAEATAAVEAAGSAMDLAIAEALLGFVAHSCEHYGQLAVYLRLNGIVPLASRG